MQDDRRCMDDFSICAILPCGTTSIGTPFKELLEKTWEFKIIVTVHMVMKGEMHYIMPADT